MTRYAKGANAERELIKLLFERGFAVARVAGSGVSSLPSPDIIALKPGKQLAMECKAWSQAYLSIPLQQMDELSSWARVSGTEMFVAWKVPHKGWFFLQEKHFTKNPKFYVVSRKKAEKQGLPIEIVTGEQSQIQGKK